MQDKFTTMGVRVGVALVATLGAVAFGGAAPAAAGHEPVAVQAAAASLSCEEILLRIQSLEARERALQDRLRHAPAWEKPAIVRMIVDVQLRIGALYAELETC